ncbi:choline/carnitine O-acyltransferase [Gephyromycinifex aptenodytis]|uniref:choline/carnitine O-acyltransferase n=1 Tax=Gephyromycinifex aptenodytis TaxID=2716227 RepID=UPI00144569B8|nr:choline/carnitine O-acyltransferase [Gephyromycinifex aptenodytis]
MTHLPVPDLDQTLQRYLDVVAPLLSAEEFQNTRRVVDEFAAGDGPACQEALLAYAKKENGDGNSWLSTTWLLGYLTGREPLPLLSNVGFQITWPSEKSGIARAADLAHRMGQVHLAYLRGEIGEQKDARGQLLCMRQWQYLAGGLRHPQPDQDEVRPGRAEAEDREIVVLDDGCAYAVRLSDSNGQIRPVRSLESELEQIHAAPRPDAAPFPAWSYLGSERASSYLHLLEDPENAAVYQRLTDALFVLTLTDETGDTEAHLRRSAFGYGQTWAYKPASYLVNLADDYVGMHVEHSTVDGATLQTAVGLAQQATSADQGAGGNDDDAAAPEALTWVMPQDERSRLAGDIDWYEKQAQPYQVSTVTVDAMPTPAVAGLRLSHDACQQIIMLFGQLRTYGHLRSTYEAVDMREFTAGRTETLRPNSTPAVELAQALMTGSATRAQLEAALAEHRQRVKWCKTGQGVDRHLFGLRVQADGLGLQPALFADVAYRRLTTDFLSTSSLGGADQFARYTFAPTSGEGIGIGYSPLPAHYEFFCSYHQERCEGIDAFAEALAEGAHALSQLISSLR